MHPDELILHPPKEAITLINSQEEVYKSALEIILSLCENYNVSLMDIQAVCKTVLKKEKENV